MCPEAVGERPTIAGITLPGMPEGSPGMTGRKTEPFKIYAVRTAQHPLFTRPNDGWRTSVDAASIHGNKNPQLKKPDLYAAQFGIMRASTICPDAEDKKADGNDVSLLSSMGGVTICNIDL